MFNQQVNNFDKISKSINGDLNIISSHQSKGSYLPVVKIETPVVNFTLRDNFYDINIFVELLKDVDFEYSEFYEPKNQEWYEEQIEKKRSYTFENWTDEEINDPRILRVQVKKPNRSYWSVVTPEAKDRWLNRYNSTDWYKKDWSGGNLIKDGYTYYLTNHGYTYYLTNHCFGEGINKDNEPQVYSKGIKSFFLYADSYNLATELCNIIYNKCLTK